MGNVEEWLDEWADTNLNTPQYYEEASAMADDAAACRAEAEKAGIDGTELTEAAGGDLKSYLLDRQNSFADSEVKRKVASDEY